MFLPRPRLKIPTSPSVPEPSSVAFRAHRLRRVLDEKRSVRAAQPAKRAHRRGKSEQMMRDDAQGPIVQCPFELVAIEIERRRIDIAENRPQSGLDDRRGDRKARVGRDDDLVPLRVSSDDARSLRAISAIASAAVPEDTRNACDTPKSSRISASIA